MQPVFVVEQVGFHLAWLQILNQYVPKNLFASLGNFSLSTDLLSKSTFSKISFRDTNRVSDRLDQDQARRFVWPDMGSNLFAKVISRRP